MMMIKEKKKKNAIMIIRSNSSQFC